ncbi:F-box only protein 39 [Electrophorus electricus]|uniref:F-box domain-containing protein n=1 Tax=Electrophorus electricus TaxID=8005 RepID=A0A4W4GZ43_ELEEL|nr:F-box only protein 39 [Electrophorus electricus]
MEYAQRPKAEEEQNVAKVHKEEEVNMVEGGEAYEHQSLWAFLPDVCLQRVFWWLHDHDRAQAALVCNQWHHVIHSPSLWRHRSFLVSGCIFQSRRSELEKAISYVKSYGSYLETLEVLFIHPINTVVARRFQLNLRSLLAALRQAGSRLRSLTIHRMELDHSAWCRSIRNALVRSMTFYLLRQGSHLSYLSLSGARFNLDQGMHVLEAVAAAQQHVHLSHRPGLATLDLQDFFAQPFPVYNRPNFASVVHRFQGLCNLTLNYSCMSDDLLKALASCCVGQNGAGSLRSFTVHCHVLEPHFQTIRGDAWALLARRCPALKVHMSVEQILAIEWLARILLREVPLHSLSLTSSYFNEFNWTAKPALASLIPMYRMCLQKLILDINNHHEPVDEELMEVVTVCTKLTYLKVWAFLDISFLDRLLQKRLKKQCILKTIKVRLYTNKHETREEDEMLEKLFSRFRQLIDSELNYFASTYPMF